MKKLLITTAVIFMTAFGANQANAELTLVTADNNGSFSFNPALAMTSLSTGVGTNNTEWLDRLGVLCRL